MAVRRELPSTYAAQNARKAWVERGAAYLADNPDHPDIKALRAQWAAVVEQEAFVGRCMMLYRCTDAELAHYGQLHPDDDAYKAVVLKRRIDG
jgi:hypothetical protein